MNEILPCKNLSYVHITSQPNVEVGSLTYCLATRNLHLNSINELTSSPWKPDHFVKLENRLATAGLLGIACVFVDTFLPGGKEKVGTVDCNFKYYTGLILVLPRNFCPFVALVRILL